MNGILYGVAEATPFQNKFKLSHCLRAGISWQWAVGTRCLEGWAGWLARALPCAQSACFTQVSKSRHGAPSILLSNKTRGRTKRGRGMASGVGCGRRF